MSGLRVFGCLASVAHWGVLGYRKSPFVVLDCTESFGHCKPTRGPNTALLVDLKVGKPYILV